MYLLVSQLLLIEKGNMKSYCSFFQQYNIQEDEVKILGGLANSPLEVEPQIYNSTKAQTEMKMSTLDPWEPIRLTPMQSECQQQGPR